MKMTACQYAIVRFAPFVETGEFANVGIVLLAPEQGYFGYRLELRRHGRITQFFEDVDARLYKGTLNRLKEELQRIQVLARGQGAAPQSVDGAGQARQLFLELVRPRETIVRFSRVRTVLAEDPDKKLQELFAFYVQRNFVTRSYQEALLEKGIRRLLHDLQVDRFFEKARIGDERYHVNFPFVRQKDGRPDRIIKPLYLAHDEPTRIYEHGDAWIRRIDRLKGRFLDPEKVLFTLGAPEEGASRLDAFRDIERELQGTGALTVPCSDQVAIERFALN